MRDLISVVVPVYNIAGDLPNCLDSILAQTYHNIEIVAVDDGSKDSSGAILDYYAEKHLNIRVIHKENGGVTSARLRGIREAAGEWIGFVDGDDVIEPDMYDRLLNNAKKYEAQISHCGYQLCLPDGRVNYFYNTGLLAKQDKITGLKELLSGSRIEPGLWNKLFHKTLFHSLLHSETVTLEIKINEDLLVNFYLFSAADRSVFDDWCPYHYIAREGSATRSDLNCHKIYDPIKVRDIIRNSAIKEIQEDAQRAYINACLNTCHELIQGGREYRKDLKKVREILKQEKHNFRLLSAKRKQMAWMITNTLPIYVFVYSFYFRHFHRNLYS